METIKAAWSWLVGQLGTDWAAAVSILFVLFLFEPALAIIGGVVYVAYKTGKLDKIIAKVKSKIVGE